MFKYYFFFSFLSPATVTSTSPLALIASPLLAPRLEFCATGEVPVHWSYQRQRSNVVNVLRPRESPSCCSTFFALNSRVLVLVVIRKKKLKSPTLTRDSVKIKHIRWGQSLSYELTFRVELSPDFFLVSIQKDHTPSPKSAGRWVVLETEGRSYGERKKKEKKILYFLFYLMWTIPS